ncbi:putative ternary complex factor MIP1, leucine-zipper [Helianthus annuus]|nr:putative ternary complex factor MIP1, leucine-zipper [Helianthus annuus]
MEVPRCKSKAAGKPILNRRLTRTERKLALLEDVDKLKKKLRQEENVHRALERAFSRRLGTLPHLPPYLPPQTLELLAEVAVLEEEVVRLEEEVVSFRHGLYQEAVGLSSRININSDNNSLEPLEQSAKTGDGSVEMASESSKLSQQKVPLNSLSRSASSRLSYSNRIGTDVLNRVVEIKPADLKKSDSVISDDGVLGKENRSSANSNSKVKSSPERVPEEMPSLVRKPQIKFETAGKCSPPKPQNRLADQEKAQESCSSSSSGDRIVEAESECNKISENVLKCLIGIFLRLSKLKAKTMDAEAFSNLMSVDLTGGDQGPAFRDPYGVCLKSKRRDIGPYKDLFAIEAGSIDFKKKMNASLLIRRLKLLLEKLASVNLEGLTHQQKLAFWINTYNICMMNAYLEHGIPESPEMMPTLMQKATINAGGYLLNAISIEHFILRLPNRLKLSCPQSPEQNETEIRGKFGLEWSEPLVTFALCNGSWSSPAVRVYTSAQVESELAIAKRDYLQAACGITKTNKLLIPNVLDRYLLDFGKDLEALTDWVCLQLPGELRKHAVTCLEKRGREPISKQVQIMSYDYRFRYLIQR